MGVEQQKPEVRRRLREGATPEELRREWEGQSNRLKALGQVLNEQEFLHLKTAASTGRAAANQARPPDERRAPPAPPRREASPAAVRPSGVRAYDVADAPLI